MERATLELRTSERSSFKRCPQQHHWGWVEQIKPNDVSTPLWFGAAVHEALADWYQQGFKRGPHPAETLELALLEDRQVIVGESEEKELIWSSALELGVDMMERYVDFYKEDPQWDVILTEQPFEIWIPHPTNGQGRWLKYDGTVDGVYRDADSGDVWLMEHKTAASIRTKHLAIDDQAGSYWALFSSKLRKMGILGPKENISGIMYNFLRKAKADIRPQNSEGLYLNKDGSVSKVQPPPYFEREEVYRSLAERRKQIEKIQAEGLWLEAVRNGTMPIFKTPRYDCAQFCDFFTLCKMDESGSEVMEEYKEANFHKWDPYEAHQRKSAEG